MNIFRLILLIAVPISLFSNDIESLLKMQKEYEKLQKKSAVETEGFSLEEIPNSVSNESTEKKSINIKEKVEIEEVDTQEENLFSFDYKGYKKSTKDGIKVLPRYGDSFFKNRNLKNGFLHRVPAHYKINIGDRVSLWIYGAKSEQILSTVDRNGNIKIEGLEPINIYNMRFDRVQSFLENRLSRTYRNSKVYVDLDKTNSIQVLVVGEVDSPGLYNIPALSTIQEVLIATGGVSESGSYRDIRVLRNGKTIKRVDIYKIISRGDTKELNFSMRTGDTIIVKPVKNRVTLYGEVNRPAIYELFPKENFIQLLKYSGGFKATTDKFRIELTRHYNNSEIHTYDLNMKKNYRLKDGDQIKLYPISDYFNREIYFLGNVLKVGKREFNKDDTLYKFLERELKENDLTSVFKKNTDFSYSLIKRINRETLREEIINFSLTEILTKSRDIKLNRGDEIHIFNIDKFKDRSYIYCYGDAVKKPQKYNFYPDMRLKDLFNFVKFSTETFVDEDGQKCNKNEFMEQNDSIYQQDSSKICHREYVKIDNKVKLLRRVGKESEVFILNRKIDSKFKIEPYDEIEFFNLNHSKTHKFATVRGEVINPGRYEIDNSTTLTELIDMAGGFTKRAYLHKFELVRYRIVNGERVHRVINNISLKDALDNSQNIEEFDEVSILKIPNWNDTKVVEIDGEVRFPGKYVLNEGDKLSTLIERAGGFKDSAFLKGTVFTREDVKRVQKKRVEESVRKLKQNLLYLASSATGVGESAEDKQRLSVVTEQLIKDMEDFQPNGRVSLKILRDIDEFRDSIYNITLKDGDKLFIPTSKDTVMVVGEVLNPNSFVYQPDSEVDFYINRAGGVTEKANDEKIYIVKANGEAVRYERGFLFGGSTDIEKGDSIIVPMRIDTNSNIKIAKDITQILYQLAITTASLTAVGLF